MSEGGGATTLTARLGARLRRALAPPTIVLLYHRVLPEVRRDINQLVTRVDAFAAHLAWVRQHARPLRLTEFLDQFRRPSRTKPALDGGKPRVLITFDDAYVDNLHHALTVLQEFNVEATVFAASGLIGTNSPFWWDELESIVFDGVGDTSDEARRRTYREQHARLKPMTHEERNAVLAELATRTGPPSSEFGRPMTWSELRVWCDAGMSVGGHTRTHPQLSAQQSDDVAREITQCRRELQLHLERAIDAFAYPFGSGEDFDERGMNAACDAGFACAFANRPGNARWAPGLYAIPRYLVRDWTGDEFAARIEEWCR